MYKLKPLKKRRRLFNGGQSRVNISGGVYPNVRGNVAAPLFPYPTANLLGHWTNKTFTEDSAEAIDYSSNKNDAILKTGRAFSVSSLGSAFEFSDLPYTCGRVVLLAKSASDSTFPYTYKPFDIDGPTINLTADNTWQEIELTVSVSEGVTLGRRSGSDNFNGSIAYVRIYDTSDVLRDIFYLNDYETLPTSNPKAISATGAGLLGTYIDGSIVSLSESTVPQLVGTDWQEYVWFDGNDDFISVAGMTSATDYFQACTIEADVLIVEELNSRSFWALGTFCYALYKNLGNYFVNATDTGIAVSEGKYNLKVDYDASGNAVEFYIDNVSVWTGSASPSTPGTEFYINALGTTGNLYRRSGLIYNFSLSGSPVKNFAFDGYGKKPFEDTTGGGNNGVENGSPVRQLVTKHSTNSTDALGNNFVQPRPTKTTFNVPPGGSVEVPDIAAYDSVQTVMGWFYYDGTDQTFIDLGTPDVTVTTGVLGSSAITAPSFYINGILDTAINEGWNFIAITTTTSFNGGPIDWNRQVANIGLYDIEITADQILKSFNKTQKDFIPFPSNPSQGAIFVYNGSTFTYSDSVWVYSNT